MRNQLIVAAVMASVSGATVLQPVAEALHAQSVSRVSSRSDEQKPPGDHRFRYLSVGAAIGGLLAVGLLALTKVLVIDSLAESITFTSWIGWPEVISVIPLVMLAGVTLSVVASFISLRRYLRV